MIAPPPGQHRQRREHHGRFGLQPLKPEQAATCPNQREELWYDQRITRPCQQPNGLQAQITFQAGAIETLALPANLDLIASASTLQWVEDPAALLKSLTTHLVPGGWLALSGFGRNHFAELQALGGPAKAPSYLDPDDWRAILPSSLHILRLEQHAITLHFPDAISLLRHLRLTGVNAAVHRHWTRAHLADFESRLRAALPPGAALALTYSPVILVAQKRG